MADNKDKFKQFDEFEHRLSGDVFEPSDTEDAAKERSSWFKRRKQGIVTSTSEKRETPEGLWVKCPNCKYTCTKLELSDNLDICPQCNYHHRIGSSEYFSILFDNQEYVRLFDDVVSKDFLEFTDLKNYGARLIETRDKTNLKDSMSVAVGKVTGHNLVVAAMDFNFIGGSLGSVMGEKICRAADYALDNKIPLLIISKSGGARMMESAFSLMQLPKTLGRLSLLSDAKIPYISLCTDPTFGGTTASFSMLGDVIIAEPGALIGFAGPRVIKETIKKDLPEGFQTSEFLMEHGFLDFIVDRKELKQKISLLLSLFAS